MPGDCQRAAEGSHLGSSETLWENGDYSRGNRRLRNRFGAVSKDSQRGLRQWWYSQRSYDRASRRSQEKSVQGLGAEWIQGGGKMMSRMINLPWISHILSVVNSNDPSLVGVSGTVLDETKKTILIRTESGDLRLAKEVITFTIDSGEAIEGSRVIQRAEDRIGRRY